MASSYIIQGTNIVCTNMRVPAPLKLGIPYCHSSVVTTNKNSYYLTEDDKKINTTFKCKMAVKKWGGLAMLCAGLAIGGAILLCVTTGGLAAPALVALAATATKVGVAVAVVGGIGAVAIGVSKEAHDCDATLESEWSNTYGTVKFQKKKALLNHSYMNCKIGGQLTLIVDDVIAQQAATFISNNNRKEIIAQLGSKFFVGVVSGLTGAANLPGVAIAIGFDYWYEDDTNKPYDGEKFQEERKTTLKGEGLNLGVAEVMDMYRITKTNQAITQQIKELGTLAFERGIAGNTASQQSALLGQKIASRSFKNYNSPFSLKKYNPAFLKNLGIGIGGTVAGFAVEQSVNVYEYNLEVETELESLKLNIKDNNNNIGVVAQL